MEFEKPNSNANAKANENANGNGNANANANGPRDKEDDEKWVGGIGGDGVGSKEFPEEKSFI